MYFVYIRSRVFLFRFNILKLKIKKEMKRLVWSPYKIIPVLVQVLYFKETHSHSICLIGQCGNLKHDWIHLFSRNWRPLKCRALNESNDVEIALLCQYGSILQTQPDTYLNCIHWKTIEGWWYTFTRSFLFYFSFISLRSNLNFDYARSNDVLQLQK